jgi:DNA-directed RNA polymerase specialized sigma24 family protein
MGMSAGDVGQAGRNEFLDHISTHWPQINNPTQFVMRYAPAIQRYIAAIVRNPHDAEEVCQEFLAKVFQQGFDPGTITRGRFRDYLKAAVRNAALTHLRRPRPTMQDVDLLADLAAPNQSLNEADQVWNNQWRACLLERIWQTLESCESQIPESLFYTVLRMEVDHPELNSDQQAERLSQRLGRPYRADAFRKQVSRARQMFARLIAYEIRQTLEKPTADDIEDELNDLNLMKYVRAYLPADWRQRGEID